MIPKVLHYCWYGHGQHPATMKMCVDSWRKHCSGYEIKEWNENNTPMDIPWIRDAYRHHKFAFVADYMRFYVLKKDGGIYLDTDMLLVRSLDELLTLPSFIGMEDNVNANFAIMGAEPGLPLCMEFMNQYDSMSFDLVHPPIITCLLTPILHNHGLVSENKIQVLADGTRVFDSSFFYPIHYSEHFELNEAVTFAKPSTFAIHLWNKSWEDEFQMFEAEKWKLGFAEVINRVKRTPFLPFAYWKKLVKYTGRYLGLWKR